jgi:hypothetical protein
MASAYPAAALEMSVAGFADPCADQNERDHVASAAAVKYGRVAAETGVQPEVV